MIFRKKKRFDPTLVELTDEQMSKLWGGFDKGGGASGVTMYDWNPTMAEKWAGPETGGLLGQAERYFDGHQQYTPYTGQRIAGPTQYMADAWGQAYDKGMNGTDLGDAARQEAFKTAQGGYLNGPQGQNPVSYNGQQTWGSTTLADDTGSWNHYIDDKSNIPGQYNWQNQQAAQAAGAGPAAQAASAGQAAQAQGTLNAGQNAYGGMNSPYFQQQLQEGQSNIIDQYNKGASADARRMANLSGAFGGSAHQALINSNQDQLNKSLNSFTGNMLNQQYDRSANLAESDLARQMQAGQFNIGMSGQNADRLNQMAQYNAGLGMQNANAANDMAKFNAGIGGQNAQMANQMAMYNGGQGQSAYENWANRAQQGSMNDLSRGAQYMNDYLNRNQQAQQFNAQNQSDFYKNWAAQDLAAQQFNAQMGSQNWNAERDRMLQGAGMGYNDEGRAMQNYRDIYNYGIDQQKYNQSLNDVNYNNFLDQQNWEWNQIQRMANLYGQAQGGVGGQVNMYNNSQTSPWAQALGTGMMGYGMFGS